MFLPIRLLPKRPESPTTIASRTPLPLGLCSCSGHGKRFELISSSFNFEWTKFEFSKNWNKFESLCSKFELSIKRASYFPISSSAPRPPGAAYVPILLSEVEQEQRPSGNGDCEAIVVGAGLCDGEGERAYTGYASHFSF